MKTIFTSVLFFMIVSQPVLKIDFSDLKDGKDWVIINDGVMGGRSFSTAILDPQKIQFTGTISLENNGGFASLRSPIGTYDLSNYDSVKIKFRSYGRSFSLMLERSQAFYKPVFKHDFKSTDDEWAEIEIKLSDFKEYRLSQFTGNYASMETLDDVLRIGVILFDKKEGPFQLEIDYLEFT